MEDKKMFTVTEEGLQNLKDKLNHLITVERPKVQNDIGVARSFGDLSENSEYDEAKENQAKIEAQIAELEEQIKNAVIVKDVPKNEVHIGKTVKVEFLDEEDPDFKIVEYTLVSTTDVKPLENTISDQSPFGSRIIGTKVGDIVTVDAPSGSYRIKILSIGD